MDLHFVGDRAGQDKNSYAGHGAGKTICFAGAGSTNCLPGRDMVRGKMTSFARTGQFLFPDASIHSTNMTKLQYCLAFHIMYYV